MNRAGREVSEWDMHECGECDESFYLALAKEYHYLREHSTGLPEDQREVTA